MNNVKSKLIVAENNTSYVEIVNIGDQEGSVIVSQVSEASKIIEDLVNFIELNQ